MASTDAIINVIVNGQQRVEQLISRTNELNSLIENIKRSPIDLTFGSSSPNARNLDSLNTQLRNTRTQLENTRSEIASGIQRMGEYRQAVQSSREALNGLSLGTVAYSRAQRRLTAAELGFEAQSAAVQRLERSLAGLQRREASEFGQVRRAEAFREQIRFAEQLADSYINVEVATRRAAGGIENMTSRRSSATLKSEIAFFDTLASNVNFASEAFRRFNVASASAGIAAGEGSRRRFSVLAEAFAPETRALVGYGPTQGRDVRAQSQANVELQNLINAFPEVARSKAGLTDYKEQLRSILDLVPAGTSNFIQLSNAIRQVDDELARFGNVARQAGPQQFISVAPSGPVSDRLNSLRQQQQYATQVNTEYKKQTDLANKITASKLAQADKDSLNLQLSQALDNLAEHRLEVSQMITNEVNKQFLTQERLLRLRAEEGKLGNRATLVSGLVGTSFMPISGELPSGKAISGSPAAKAAELKANQEATQAAVALARQKMQAAEQEAEESRRATQAAVALAQQKDKSLRQEAERIAKEMRSGTAAQVSLGQQKLKAIEDERKRLNNETSAAVALAQQKEKALQDEAKNLRDQTAAAVALGQQKMNAEQRAQSLQGRIGMSWKTALAGGQELVQENQVKNAEKSQEEAAAAIEKINSFYRKLVTLQNNYNINEQNGVKFLQEKADLETEVNRLKSGSFQATKQEADSVGKLLAKYREMLAIRISEAKVAGTYNPSGGSKSLTAEQIETRRSNLLSNALSLQGSMVSLEGRGAEIAAEKLELETKIARLKQLQGNATAQELKTLLIEIQQLRLKSKEVQNAMPQEMKKAPFLERKFGLSPEKASAVSEGLVGGAFPLLFGQGIGASIGGGLGGALGGLAGGGLGFGLSLLGTTLGSFLDSSIAAAKALGNALIISGDNANELRQQGVYYTAELEKQVRLLKRQGDYAKAQELTGGAVFAQAGDVNATATKAIALETNKLGKAWTDVQKSVGTTLGIIAAPFMAAITSLLQGVSAIFKIINAILSAIGYGIHQIPLLGAWLDKLQEKSLKGTAEYENQVAELDKQIEASKIANSILIQKNNIIGAALFGSKAEYDIALKKADALERAKNLEKEIADLREKSPVGTQELRDKLAAQENQLRVKYAQEEKKILMSSAREIYDQIIENNRRITQVNKQNQIEYKDLVRQTARQQADIDLTNARKLEDIRLGAKQKELEYTKTIAQEELKSAQIAADKRSFLGGISAKLSPNPVTSDIVNNVETAIEKWRLGRRSVEEEAAAKQQELQLAGQKAEIEIQRLKYDNALKIARANEDSQLKITRMQEAINKQNEEVSRNEFERKKTAIYVDAAAKMRENMLISANALAALQEGGLNPDQQKRTHQIATDAATLQQGLMYTMELVQKKFKETPVLKLSGIGPAPRLTDTSAPSTKALEDANAANAEFEKQINLLQTKVKLEQNDLDLAKALLDPSNQQLGQLNEIVKAQEEANAGKKMYRDLINAGILPSLAEEQIKIEQTRDTQLMYIDTLMNALQKYASDPEVQKILTQLQGVRGGVTSRSDTAIINAANASTPFARLTSEITTLKGEMLTLLDPVNQITGAAASIGDAFSKSFTGVISGSMTAKDALANFFKSTADFFLDMAGQIIAKMIQMAILNQIVKLLPGGTSAGMGGANYFDPKTGLGVAGPNFGLALGGIVGRNGIQQFARGGIVNSPTLFRFANGGAMRTGLMGEAGPEAVMPLTRGPGGRLGVDASGSSGSVNVTVNVDASGSKVQGDNGRAGELGRAVSAAVQQELIKQKRPGGLLA